MDVYDLANTYLVGHFLVYGVRDAQQEKKKEICLSAMRKAPISTEKS